MGRIMTRIDQKEGEFKEQKNPADVDLQGLAGGEAGI